MKQSGGNEFFPKILRYVTIAIVIIIAIAEASLYYTFSNIQLKNIYSSSKNNLSQVSYSANFMTDSARSLLVQMYLDNNIAQLRYNNGDFSDNINAQIAALVAYSQSMPFVSSIYIYNGRSDMFYTTLTNIAEVKQKDFFDKQIIEIMKHPGSSAITLPIARKVMVQQDNSLYKNVFTFIFYDRNASGKVDNAIILNLSELWVRKVIKSLSTENSSDIFVIDKKGEIISGVSHPGSNKNKYEKIPFTKKLTKTSGYFIQKYNGENSLITYATAKGLDWKFVCVVPYSKIDGMLNHLRNTTIILCMFILALGLIISFFVSRKVYKPINNALEDFKQLAEEAKKPSESMKREYLKKLMLNEISFDLEKYSDNFMNYKISIDYDENICMILLRIDHAMEFYGKYNCEDRDTLRYGIGNIANEIFSKFYTCEYIDVAMDQIALIFNIEKYFDHDEVETIEALLEETKRNVKQLLQLQITCTVGPENYSVSAMAKLYNETLKISNYRMFYGFESIMWSRRMEKNKKYVYPMNTEKMLLESMLCGKLEEVKKYYRLIINDDFQYCEYSQFEAAILKLAFSTNSVIDTIEKTQNLKIDFSFSKFVSKLDYLETLEEIERHFFDMFDELDNKLSEKKNIKHNELINTVIGMIDSKYKDPNLCLDTLADNVNMSSIYLGRLFKKSTLKSVSDYINEVRMQHAVEYLTTTDININKIVEKVGYSNRCYFYTIFKKTYGTTPNDYRKGLQSNVIN